MSALTRHQAGLTGDALAAASSSTALAVVPQEGEFTEEELYREFIACRRAAQWRLQLQREGEKRKADAITDSPQVAKPSHATSVSAAAESQQQAKAKAKGKGKAKAGSKAKAKPQPKEKPWSSLEAIDRSIDHARAEQLKRARVPTSSSSTASAVLQIVVPTKVFSDFFAEDGSVLGGALPELMRFVNGKLEFEERMKFIKGLAKTRSARICRFQEFRGIEVLAGWFQAAAKADIPPAGRPDEAGQEITAIIELVGRMNLTLEEARETNILEAFKNISLNRKQERELAAGVFRKWQKAANAGTRTLDEPREDHAASQAPPVSSLPSPPSPATRRLAQELKGLGEVLKSEPGAWITAAPPRPPLLPGKRPSALRKPKPREVAAESHAVHSHMDVKEEPAEEAEPNYTVQRRKTWPYEEYRQLSAERLEELWAISDSASTEGLPSFDEIPDPFDADETGSYAPLQSDLIDGNGNPIDLDALAESTDSMDEDWEELGRLCDRGELPETRLQEIRNKYQIAAFKFK